MNHPHILDATLRTLSPDRYFWIGCVGLIVLATIGIVIIGLGAWMDVRDARRASQAGEC